MEENQFGINKDLLEQIERIRLLSQQFRQPVLEIAKLQQQVQETLKEPIANAIKLQQSIQSCYSDSFKSVIKKVAELQEYMKINLPKIAEHYKLLAENQKLLAERMIKSGWYYSLKLPLDAYKLLELNEQDFDEVLIEFYEQYEEDMINRIKDQYPHRKHILSKVYEAHKRGDYELSIPAMFTQSDGIVVEIFDSGLFSKNKGKLSTSYQTEILFDEDKTFDICFIIQLSTIGQLNKNYNPDTYKDCKMFNRHTEELFLKSSFNSSFKNIVSYYNKYNFYKIEISYVLIYNYNWFFVKFDDLKKSYYNLID